MLPPFSLYTDLLNFKQYIKCHSFSHRKELNGKVQSQGLDLPSPPPLLLT